MRIKTSIIGLGKIGLKYDESHKYKIGNYTSEVTKNKNLELVSVSDLSYLNLKNYQTKLKTKFFKSIDQMLKVTKPELIIISSSTISQYEILKKILKYNPKYIVVEKPVCENSFQLRKIMKIKNKSKIFVNYVKRYNPIYEDTLNLIKKKTYGNIKSLKISYSGDNFNIGSHSIDLINYLINENIKTVKKIKSFKTKNFELSFFELNKKYEIQFKNYRIKSLYFFELEIIFEKGKIRISNNETKLTKYKLVKTFKDFRNSQNFFYEFLETNVINYKISKETLVSKFLKKIFNSKKRSNLADFKDAINVHNIFEKIF